MTNKKLIDLMLENNVQWPEGAEFAAQDKESSTGDLCAQFYSSMPIRKKGKNYWVSGYGTMSYQHCAKLPELCRNWHQTVVTREQYEAAQVRRNSAKRATECAQPSKCVGKLHVDVQVSDIVTQIESAQRESQRHEEAMLAANERELELREQLNGMLAKVGMKVVDNNLPSGTVIKTTGEKLYTAQPEYEVSKPSRWPDYCDEHGIVVDWDKVPEGSEVFCVYNADWDFFDVGSIYKVGMDTYLDYGPIDSDGDAPCSEKLSEMEFRLIK